tara:strand:+ start:1271 stop:1477 length:207 start_codon:yes stop_codon:yes gene_type:complete
MASFARTALAPEAAKMMQIVPQAVYAKMAYVNPTVVRTTQPVKTEKFAKRANASRVRKTSNVVLAKSV